MTCDFDLTGGTSNTATQVIYTIDSSAGSGSGYFSITLKPKEPALTVGGLVLWLRADSFSDLADGAPIPSWPDVSGNNNNANQANAALQPVLVKSAFNGKPAVWFDGADDFLASVDSATLRPNEMTIITVASFDVVDNNRQVLVSKRAPRPDWHSYAQLVQGTGYWFTVQNTVSQVWPLWITAFTRQAGLPNLFSSTYRKTGGNGGDALNKVDGAGTVNFGANGYANGFTIDHGNDPLEIGRHVDAFGNPALLFLGNISEVMIFNRQLSPSERAEIEAGLKAKYGTL